MSIGSWKLNGKLFFYTKENKFFTHIIIKIMLYIINPSANENFFFVFKFASI